jgi:hypothetical protein
MILLHFSHNQMLCQGTSQFYGTLRKLYFPQAEQQADVPQNVIHALGAPFFSE